ncbi:hypothetical protein A4X16_07350 [Microbacterium sp. H83]|nr:hypothetical protein A4X16_07350 [Microbacterium sp. H83]
MNAAWYNTAACAVPATIHPAVNTTRSGAAATMTSPPAPTMLPTVMIIRGPRSSSQRPTTTPAIAEATSPPENDNVTSTTGHPVSSAIAGEATINA